MANNLIYNRSAIQSQCEILSTPRRASFRFFALLERLLRFVRRTGNEDYFEVKLASQLAEDDLREYEEKAEMLYIKYLSELSVAEEDLPEKWSDI